MSYPIGKCPKCSSELVVRTSRYGGQFIGCSNYPKCTNIWPLPKDKFEKTGIETEKAKFIQPPLIKNATVNFECRLVSETDAGDHILFLGEILASYINEEKKVLFNVKTVDGERVFEEFPQKI